MIISVGKGFVLLLFYRTIVRHFERLIITYKGTSIDITLFLTRSLFFQSYLAWIKPFEEYKNVSSLNSTTARNLSTTFTYLSQVLCYNISSSFTLFMSRYYRVSCFDVNSAESRCRLKQLTFGLNFSTHTTAHGGFLFLHTALCFLLY